MDKPSAEQEAEKVENELEEAQRYADKNQHGMVGGMHEDYVLMVKAHLAGQSVGYQRALEKLKESIRESSELRMETLNLAEKQAERRGEERGAKAAFKAARCENVLNGIGKKDVMEILHYQGIEFTHPLFHIWFKDWRNSEEYKNGKAEVEG